MEKAQAEVRSVFDGKGHVDETAIDKLKFLKAVVNETLRLHPPFPLLLPRECREMCKINGYEIPEKTRIIVNAWAIGRDSDYWVEAERFYPERFHLVLEEGYVQAYCLLCLVLSCHWQICSTILTGNSRME